MGETTAKAIGVLIAMSLAPALWSSISASAQSYHGLSPESLTADNTAEQVATALAQAGIEPGQSIAFIGYGFDSYWARVSKAENRRRSPA